MDGRPLQLALREMRAAFTSPVSLAALAVATAVLAISGPFGTFASFSLTQRVAYWAVTVVLGYGTGRMATALFAEMLRPHIRQRWPLALVAALLAALPITLIVVTINGVAYRDFSKAEPVTLWAYTTAVTLAIVVTLGTLADRLRDAAPGAGAAAATTPPASPAILERVPPPQRGRLLALSVEDHYVDIVTDRGKTLVLMRLADAMKETGSVRGLQIHRSHWVAFDAVVKTHRAEGKTMLELSNGMRLPVSRGFLPGVKAAGFGG